MIIFFCISDRPVFLSNPPEKVDLQKGESHTLNLTAKGNPEPVLYKWSYMGMPVAKPVIDTNWRVGGGYPDISQGLSIGDSRVTADGPLLYLNGVDKQDAGPYELEASNQQGTTVSKVFINIMCKY